MPADRSRPDRSFREGNSYGKSVRRGVISCDRLKVRSEPGSGAIAATREPGLRACVGKRRSQPGFDEPLLACTGIRGRRREHLVENQLYRSSSSEGSIYGTTIGRLARRGPPEGRKNGRKGAIGQRSQGACPSSGIDTVHRPGRSRLFKDRFDIGRFRALQHAVAEFIASDQGVAYERVENWIALDSHYPTPKLDVRALILDSQQRVLLVREASDGRWTLPGGWCDVNESPQMR